MTPTPAVPKGLSRPSQQLWRELTAEHRFEGHELLVLRRSLEWFDRSDQLVADAAGLAGRDAAAVLKLAMDASNCALRYWRTLKFVDASSVRRPGRPAGDAWSPKRRLAKLEEAG